MKKYQYLILSLFTFLLIGICTNTASAAEYSIKSISINGTSYEKAAIPTPITLPSISSPNVTVGCTLDGDPDPAYTYLIRLNLAPSGGGSTISNYLTVTGKNITFGTTALNAGTTYDGNIYIIKSLPTEGGHTDLDVVYFTLVVGPLDTTAPTVSSSSPTQSATNVSISDNIIFTMSENIKLPTDSSTAFSLKTSTGTAVPATIAVNNATITVDPTANLAYSTAYTLTLNSSISDTAGNTLTPYTLNFTTAASPAIAITSRYPTIGATSISLTASITLNINQPVDTSTVNASNIYLSDPSGNKVTCNISSYNYSSYSIITLTPTSSLLGTTTYTVTIQANKIRDINGNTYLPAETWSFTTESLNIYDQYPSSGTDDFPVDNAITFRFNQMVMENTVKSGSVYLERYDSTGKISGSVDYDQSAHRVTLKPSKLLEYDTEYRVVVTSDITDVYGNAFKGAKWRFTTESRDGGTSLIYSKDPSPNERNVPTDQPITFRFSTRMDEDTIDEDTVYLRRDGSSSDIDASITYDEDTRTVTLTPEDSLRINTEYTIYVSSRIEDASGDRINSANWSFTTGDYEASHIDSRNPSPNEKDVPLDTRIKIEFTDDIKSSTIKTSSIYLRKSGYSSNIKCDISYNSANREVTLAPQDNLLPDTSYTVYITSKVEDSSGNKLSAISWSFTTTDNERQLIYRSPEIGADQVPVNTQIIVGFTMPLTASTVNSTTCYVTYNKNNVYGSTRLPVKVSYNSSDRQIIIKPSAKLEYNTEYTVTISDRVKDYTDNFTDGLTWSFTTVADPTPRGTIDRPLVKIGTEYIRSAYMKNNRTMVPYRDILEALGASVSWNGSQQKVSATLKNNTTELYIGKKTGYKNGTSVTLEVAPELRNGRTMIPLRFISEALGKKVKWDEPTCTVTIQ